jgi:hypothetical protein
MKRQHSAPSSEDSGPAALERPPRRQPLAKVMPLLTTGLVILGGGFYWGWTTRAGIKPSEAQLRAQEEERVLALGWKASAEGVLTRWCSDDCNPPRLYGGGRAEVFEVWCRQRPCGDIRATFEVLNRQGKVLGTLSSNRTGLQGERLRLVVVSPDPQADRFQLKQFSAQAMVF